MMQTGWIGTGNMGVRMAQRLIHSGYRLNVYNRTAEKAAGLLETGKAEWMCSPAAVAQSSDIIFISVTDDNALRQIFYGESGLLCAARPGQIIVEMSTIDPGFSMRLRQATHERGLQFVDAPVVGSMFMIEQGLLKILVSGEEPAYRAALPYFNSIGKSCTYLGTGVEARYMKIAVNMVICSYLTVYGEVLMVGEGFGFGWDELNQILESGAGASPMLFDKGSTQKSRVWEGTTALASTAMKDLGLALSCADQMGLALPLTAMVCQYDNFMYHSRKYCRYSTFGTIGVLEDWCQLVPDAVPAIGEEERLSAAIALEGTLAGAAALLSAEAVQLCRSACIDLEAAVGLLSTCHGAAAYIRQYCARESDSRQFTLSAAQRALHTSLNVAKNRGLFVPILAAAEQQLYGYANAIGADAPLGSVIR